MNSARTTPEVYPRRLNELEEQFGALEPELAESPEKQALSILHGLVREVWRNVSASSSPLADRDLTLRDIADLYRHAPKMESPARNTPLPVGTVAPDFALPDASGRTVRLSDFRGRPVVLAFYPLDWSPACSRQLDLYQSERAEFDRRGTQLIGLSVDSIYSHGAWSAVRGIEFPLLADFHPKGAVAQAYNVWRREDGFSERALYVIDRDGVIRYAHVSPFLHHVPDIYELFGAIDVAIAPTSDAEVRDGAMASGGEPEVAAVA